MKKLKHLVIPEVKPGTVAAIEGIGDFVSKAFGGKKEEITSDKIQELIESKQNPNALTQFAQEYLNKTLLNQKWVDANLKTGDKSAVTCRAAFINGKPESNPEKLVACLKGMQQVANHVLKVLDANTKLRQSLCKTLMSPHSPQQADDLYLKNKDKLISWPADYYLKHGGKNVQFAVGQNPADKETGFPVNRGKDDGTSFENYYSNNAPSGCTVAAPTYESAQKYASCILELAGMIKQSRELAVKNRIPYWEFYAGDYNELRYGDEIFDTIFTSQANHAIFPLQSVDAIATELVTMMLRAI